MNNAKLLRGLLLFAILAGIAIAAGHGGTLDATAVERLVASAGATAPLLFVLGYAVATVFFMPGSVLTLAAGALFGPVAGAFYSLTGATLGATLAFLIARFLAGAWAARKAGGRLRDFVQGVEADGLAVRRIRAPGAAVSIQSRQLCARPDPHTAGSICTRFVPLHAARGVCAIGDVAGIMLTSIGKPLPKAGVLAHNEAEVVAHNIARAIAGNGGLRQFLGEGACFVETGDGRAGFGSGN